MLLDHSLQVSTEFSSLWVKQPQSWSLGQPSPTFCVPLGWGWWAGEALSLVKQQQQQSPRGVLPQQTKPRWSHLCQLSPRTGQFPGVPGGLDCLHQCEMEVPAVLTLVDPRPQMLGILSR